MNLRKLTMSALTLMLSLAPVSAAFSLMPTSARAATLNTVVKGSGQTLYWYNADGKRYVFPNSQTFFSWYPSRDFSQVQTLGDTELYTLPLGGNVTYRPGAKLIKVTTDPRVYAVSRYGTLRWVTSESIARSLYGENWARLVDDVPDAFFTNYTIGAPIYTLSEYNVNNELSYALSPGDSLGNTGNNNNNNNNGAVSADLITSVDRSTLGINDTLILTATVDQSKSRLPANWSINIQDPRTATIIKSCQNAYSCSTSLVPGIRLGVTRIIFHAILKDDSGTILRDTWFPTVTVTNTDTTPSTVVAPVITSPTMNQVLRNYPRAFDLTWKGSTEKKYVIEYGCDTCVSASNLYASPELITVDNYATRYSLTGAGDNTFRARIKAINANGMESAWSDYVYFSFRTTSASTPVTPVVTFPINNDTMTNFPRSFYVRWEGSSAKKHVIEYGCDTCVSVSNLYASPELITVDNYATEKTFTAVGDNTFRVRVKAVNENGVESSWSAYTYFSFRTAPSEFTGTVEMTADNTYMTPPTGNTTLNMTATVSNLSVPVENIRIDLYADFNEQYIQKTCYGIKTCTETLGFQNVTVETGFRYYAVVSDGHGRQLQRAYTPYVKVAPKQ